MKKETFSCPFCKGTIRKKPLFTSDRYTKRLTKLQREQRRNASTATPGGGLPLDAPQEKSVDKMQLHEIKKLLETKKSNLLQWKMPQNLAATQLADVIHNTRLLCENNGVTEPENYEGEWGIAVIGSGAVVKAGQVVAPNEMIKPNTGKEEL